MKPQVLMSGRVLAVNAFWSLLGLLAPIMVGILAIPPLLGNIGAERFGLLAIVWMGVGYFSLFDMGFGRALTKLVSDRLGGERPDEIGSLVWSALWTVAGFGLLGAVLLGILASTLVLNLLNVAPGLQEEAIGAMRILASGLPVVIVTSALIGLLEAYQRFAWIAAVRIPLGVSNFLLPLFAAQFTPSLEIATATLLGVRIAAALVYFTMAIRVQPALRVPCAPLAKSVMELFQFGGWITVSNLVGPLMVYFDRFLIGALLSMSAVAYYVTPYEILTRMQMVPQSVVGVLFPALAVAAVANRVRLVTLYREGGKTLLLVMGPLSTAAFLFGHELLQFWLGGEFAAQAFGVVHWLAPGLLINTMARMPFTALQSGGRSDLTAKAHVVELLPYLAALWWLTENFGIAGTAAAWSLRVLADHVACCVLVGRVFPELRRETARELRTVIVVVLGFGLAWFVTELAARAILLIVVCAFSARMLWPHIRRMATRRNGGA